MTTWTQECMNDASGPALFITALPTETGFGPAAQWITSNASNRSKFLLRTVVPAPAPDTIQRVLGFVPAVNGNTAMTFDYKLFVNGTFVSGGPSRGEAKIWDGDGPFACLPHPPSQR